MAAFSFQNTNEYFLNGVPIPVMSWIKDIGIGITLELNFDLHIGYIIRSASITMISRCFLVKNFAFYPLQVLFPNLYTVLELDHVI